LSGDEVQVLSNRIVGFCDGAAALGWLRCPVGSGTAEGAAGCGCAPAIALAVESANRVRAARHVNVFMSRILIAS
jgi:hypothetical protein